VIGNLIEMTLAKSARYGMDLPAGVEEHITEAAVPVATAAGGKKKVH
jgi:hypothetical protein